MKLSFIILVFLLSTVAGNRPSPARRVGHGAQRSNVVKHIVGSGGTLSLNKHHPTTGKSSNPISGKEGKTQQQQNAVQATRSPNLNPSTGKTGSSNNGKDGKTQQQKNAVQPTRPPNSNPSTGKSSNPNNGKDGKTQQQQNAVQATRSHNLNPSTGKTGSSSNGKDRKTQQQKNAVQPTRPPNSNPSTGKSNNPNNGKDGKTQQQKNAVQPTRPPNSNPSTGKSNNPNNGKDGKTQQQQNAVQPTRSPNSNPSSGKSSNSNSGKNGKTPQQQNMIQPTRSTDSIPSTEQSSSPNNGKDGKTQQLQNAAQKTPTSTLKPTTTEKSNNSSSAKDGETPQQKQNYSLKTVDYHHYHYSPPQQINYGSTFYPVYQGNPPVYVYEYRDSGSRFDNLLTGLALYNLGRNSRSHRYSSESQYSGTPGEVCKLGISKRTGEYEESRIDCNLMSSFIWEDTTSTTRNEQHVVKNTTEVKVTQTVSGTGNSSVTTVSATSNTVEDALKVKGPSIAVTPGMTCFMIRTFRDTTALRKPVDCELLQEYERSSLFHNSAQCLMPFMTIAFNFLIIFVGLRI